jgi:hypothetical protein
MRDFEIFKYLIFMHLIFANWALRSTPGLPQKILPLFHFLTKEEHHREVFPVLNILQMFFTVFEKCYRRLEAGKQRNCPIK